MEGDHPHPCYHFTGFYALLVALTDAGNYLCGRVGNISDLSVSLFFQDCFGLTRKNSNFS